MQPSNDRSISNELCSIGVGTCATRVSCIRAIQHIQAAVVLRSGSIGGNQTDQPDTSFGNTIMRQRDPSKAVYSLQVYWNRRWCKLSIKHAANQDEDRHRCRIVQCKQRMRHHHAKCSTPPPNLQTAVEFSMTNVHSASASLAAFVIS